MIRSYDQDTDRDAVNSRHISSERTRQLQELRFNSLNLAHIHLEKLQQESFSAGVRVRPDQSASFEEMGQKQEAAAGGNVTDGRFVNFNPKVFNQSHHIWFVVHRG